MQNALFGTEVEFGCVGELNPADAASMTKDAVFLDYEHGVIDPAPREWGETPGNGGFLFNGGRLYIDSGHIEYATPECRSLSGLVANELAGERILMAAINSLSLQDSVYFVKNNIDYFGNTFGYHENYAMQKSPDTNSLVNSLMPFVVTRQLFAGAGMVMPSPMNSDYSFEIAQRSYFVEIDQSSRVRHGGRPIINTRDEPLGQASRLHLIAGDSNRSEIATALKVGTTALVVQMLDQDWAPPLYMTDPVRDLKQLASNYTGGWVVEDDHYGNISAIDVQRMYMREAGRRFSGRDDDTDWTLSQWENVLDDLEEDPFRLNGTVDWVTKLQVLDKFAETSRLGWADPDLIKIDQSYHLIDPELSLYARLKERDETGMYVAEGSIKKATKIAPTDTRAHARAKVVRALAEADASKTIPWKLIHSGLGELTVWDANLYLVYQYIDNWRDLVASGAHDMVPYLIDWDGIVVQNQVIEMPDAFTPYDDESTVFANRVASVLDQSVLDQLEPFESPEPADGTYPDTS